MNFQQTAKKYLSMGISIIPIRGPKYAKGDDDLSRKKDSKRPLCKWEFYQQRLATDAEIKEWGSKWPDASIGIVTGGVSGLVVLDLDEPDKAKTVLNTLIPDSISFPVARTLSGGEHWYFTPNGAELRNSCREIPGTDVRGEGGYVVAPPSFGYTWLHVLEGRPPSLPDAVSSLLAVKDSKHIYNKEFIQNLGENVGDSIGNDDNLVTMFEEGRRDNDLFHVANALSKGGLSDREIFQVLRTIGKSWGEEYEHKWFMDKIASVAKRTERRHGELAKEVREWVLSSKGTFLSSNVIIDLGLSSNVIKKGDLSSNVIIRRERQAVSNVLGRMCEEGIIQRVGDKNGQFRKVDDKADPIDFLAADDTPFDITWPFEIETLVHTHAKSIVLVAGASNSGKTAFLLDTARRNMHNHKVNYFSSEMGKTELKSRLSKFDIPMTDWKRCKFMERSSNFADVIRPDEINIIDFLELHNDFFMVGQLIKDIFDRLNKGIAIIALQKNIGRDFGLGGERSVEKARLYIAMDHHKIKIVKGKNWAKEGRNPNGLEREFKLAQGCRFVPETGWEKVDSDSWNVLSKAKYKEKP